MEETVELEGGTTTITIQPLPMGTDDGLVAFVADVVEVESLF